MYRNQKRYTRRPKRDDKRSFSGFSRGNNRGRRNNANQSIDINLFVKKAKQNTPVQAYTAKHTFADFAISTEIKTSVQHHGYTTPTPIQDQAIPYILEGKDVIGLANTGTGKTAAFLIPLINKVQLNRNERVLIITPTRELALQIYDELQAFAYGLSMGGALCIGGSSMFRQIEKLRRNPNFVVGTPGRIKDHIQRRTINLQSFRNIVLDEVDRMLDIGFVKDVKTIVSLLPQPRQSLFFSATLDERTKEIMREFVKDPVTVSVKTGNTSDNVDQDIIRVLPGKKIDQLQDLLSQDGFDKVMVFGRTKWGIEKLTKTLVERGFKAAAIHGNKSQGQRQLALEQFKNNKIQLLIATDVASRGIDVHGVTHVINYDVPATYDDYVHRIGRTGRANQKGKAFTFVE
jgi:superfamily II DNA/RNA helicase